MTGKWLTWRLGAFIEKKRQVWLQLNRQKWKLHGFIHGIPIRDVEPSFFVECDAFAPACHNVKWLRSPSMFPPSNLRWLFLNRIRVSALGRLKDAMPAHANTVRDIRNKTYDAVANALCVRIHTKGSRIQKTKKQSRSIHLSMSVVHFSTICPGPGIPFQRLTPRFCHHNVQK